MTKVMTVSQVRADIYNVMDETASTHEPILITGKRTNAVMLSQEDWNAIQETLYLVSIPNMRESIIEGLNTSIEDCDTELERQIIINLFILNKLEKMPRNYLIQA